MASEHISGRDPDPLAASLRPSADLEGDQPQLPGPTFVGFFDRGQDADHMRLFLGVGRYVEFKAEDVVEHADVPWDQSPVLGEKATAIRLQPEARVNYIREEAGEQFDLRLHAYDIEVGDLTAFGHGRVDVDGNSYFPSCKSCHRTCRH